MKVLFITHYDKLYGANRSLLNVIDEMKERNILPYVILPKKGALSYELDKRNVLYKIYPFRPWTRKVGEKRIIMETAKKAINYSIAKKVKKDIINWGIDLIHTNSSCTEIGALAAYWVRKPHVWHLREFMEEDYNIEFYLNKQKVINIMNKSERIIVISKALREKYVQYFTADKMKVIYNGVEYLDSYKHLKETPDNKQFTILMVGIISINKGQKEAIEAIEVVVNKGYKNVRLLIVGSGGAYENELKETVKAKNLEEYILFLGYRDDVNILMENSNLCLVCSKKEAFGRVTVEAMLAKVPIIASKTGATVELIQHGINGLLYEFGDHAELANNIIYAINNPNKLEKIMENAFANAKTNYTIKQNVSKILQEYNEIIKCNRDIGFK